MNSDSKLGCGCLSVFAAFFLVIIIFAALGYPGRFASESNARQALVTQGFSNITLKQRHVYFVQFDGCGKEDVARFDFSATNPAGHRVQVDVCEGWPFKGATIRYP